MTGSEVDCVVHMTLEEFIITPSLLLSTYLSHFTPEVCSGQHYGLIFPLNRSITVLLSLCRFTCFIFLKCPLTSVGIKTQWSATVTFSLLFSICSAKFGCIVFCVCQISLATFSHQQMIILLLTIVLHFAP